MRDLLEPVPRRQRRVARPGGHHDAPARLLGRRALGEDVGNEEDVRGALGDAEIAEDVLVRGGVDLFFFFFGVVERWKKMRAGVSEKKKSNSFLSFLFSLTFAPLVVSKYPLMRPLRSPALV